MKQTMSARWTIYRIICIPTKKPYIGITKYTIPQRWRKHVTSVERGENGTILGRAIRRHGEGAFILEKIAIVDSRERAAELEKELISVMGTFAPDGMNMTIGGEGTAGFRRPHSTVTKLKMSAASIGKPKSDEARRNMSIAKTGTKRPESDKQKIREKMNIIWSDPEIKMKKLKAMQEGRIKMRAQKTLPSASIIES